MGTTGAMWGFASGIALAGWATTAGQAARADYIDGFKAETVSAILTDAGAKEINSAIVEDEPRVTFKIGETNYIADFYECKDTAKGCKILQFVVIFEPDATDTVQAVNEFNKKYLYGKAALDKVEGLFSMRMINGAAGSSKGQVAVEFVSFLGATNLLLEHLKAATVANHAPEAGAPTFLNAAAPNLPAALPAKLKGLPKNRR